LKAELALSSRNWLNHPGTKPNDLLEQVKAATEAEIPRFFGQVWDEVADYEGY